MKILVNIDGIETLVEIDLVPREEDGREIKDLLSTMTDGKYDVDTVTVDANKLVQQLKDANTDYEQQVQELTKDVPESEKLTWTKQETEARAYLLDNTVSTPLIDGIVTARGVDKAYLVSKIIEKADLYAAAVGVLTGQRQAIEDSIAIP